MSATTFKRNRLPGRIVRRTIAAHHVADAIGTITPGCELYGLTKGQWSLVDLITYTLQTTGPADVVISTWTAASADIGFANALLTDGAIRTLRFIVDFSFQSRQPAYTAALREAFGDDAIRITKNHAKFVMIRNDRWNLVIRTSMNLNENRRLESWEMSDDQAMADWLQQVIDELFQDQPPEQTFTRRPGDHVTAFETQWGEQAADPAKAHASTDTKKYFGDGPLDNDIRRAGITFNGGKAKR